VSIIAIAESAEGSPDDRGQRNGWRLGKERPSFSKKEAKNFCPATLGVDAPEKIKVFWSFFKKKDYFLLFKNRPRSKRWPGRSTA
jgi:hypothetical protein